MTWLLCASKDFHKNFRYNLRFFFRCLFDHVMTVHHCELSWQPQNKNSTAFSYVVIVSKYCSLIDFKLVNKR